MTTNTNTADKTLLEKIATNILVGEVSTTGGFSAQRKLKGGGAIVASQYGGQDVGFVVSEKLLPPPYNTEYKALKKAHTAVRAEFVAMTMPFGNLNGKKASGKRAITPAQLLSGEFDARMNKVMADLDAAREACACTITQRVSDLQADNVLGTRFDPSAYPTPDQIRQSFTVTISRPVPIADGSQLNQMNIPGAMIRDMQAALEAETAQQMSYGQQQLGRDLLDYLKNAASQLSKLDTWFSTQEGNRPPVYETLMGNITDTVKKIRTFAIPGTEEGDAMLELATRVEHQLQPDLVNHNRLKVDHKETRNVQKSAEVTAEDVEDALDELFGGF